MLDLLSGFVTELRKAGLPVSLTEHLDAADAVHHIPLEDREALKYALAATLVKSSAHWRAFETAFEVFFAVRTGGHGVAGELDADGNELGEDADGAAGTGEGGTRGKGRSNGSGGSEGMTPEELAEMLFKSLLSADAALMNAVARGAVDRYAGMEPGRPVGGTYYLYRTLRNLDLDAVLAKLMSQAQAGAAGGALTDLEERLAGDEYRARIEKFRRAVETEIRRRLVEDRGAEALARSVRKPLPEDIDVMHATRDELAVLHRVLQPLSRKLAVRLARKRRHGRKGPLDFRATMRRSLSTGGVPIEPRFRHPRPAKPEIFVIADISGSVASFARFTLHLVYAISSQFSKVRSFVFVDGIDEVTRFFEGVVDPAEAVARINLEADVIWVDGHSDYGHALTEFHRRWGDEVTSRSSILLLGDARNNYHASQSWVIEDLQRKARHVFWLNPEPRDYWGSGDSIVGEYAAHCDDVVECRTLRQLEHFVGNLARSAPTPGSDPAGSDPAGSDPANVDPTDIDPVNVDTTDEPGAVFGVPSGIRRVFAPMAGATRIVLVRHGEATCNVNGIVGGRRGCTGLTELGRRQVSALAARLASSQEFAGTSTLYASVLPRAKETAELLRPVLGSGTLEIRQERDLCELLPGEADGLGWQEVVDRFGSPEWDSDPDLVIAPGGESWSGFVARASGAVRQLAERHPGEVVVAAVHAGVIEASMIAFLAMPPEAARRGWARIVHASLTEWEWVPTQSRWVLIRFNDACGVPFE